VNEEGTQQIEQYCEEQDIPVVARIPFDTRVTAAQVHGVPIVEYTDDEQLVGPIREAWRSIVERFDAMSA
jgi:MinD superfamily P-loop ATPase